MKISRKDLKIVVELKNDNGVYLVYIPDVAEERITPIVPVLYGIYSNVVSKLTGGVFPFCDYEYYIDKYSDDEKTKQAVYNFLELSLSNAEVISPDLKGKKFFECNFCNEDINEIKGQFLFFYSLLRYTYRMLGDEELRGWTTSLTFMEFLNSRLTA